MSETPGKLVGSLVDGDGKQLGTIHETEGLNLDEIIKATLEAFKPILVDKLHSAYMRGRRDEAKGKPMGTSCPWRGGGCEIAGRHEHLDGTVWPPGAFDRPA